MTSRTTKISVLTTPVALSVDIDGCAEQREGRWTSDGIKNLRRHAVPSLPVNSSDSSLVVRWFQLDSGPRRRLNDTEDAFKFDEVPTNRWTPTTSTVSLTAGTAPCPGACLEAKPRSRTSGNFNMVYTVIATFIWSTQRAVEDYFYMPGKDILAAMLPADAMRSNGHCRPEQNMGGSDKFHSVPRERRAAAVGRKLMHWYQGCQRSQLSYYDATSERLGPIRRRGLGAGRTVIRGTTKPSSSVEE